MAARCTDVRELADCDPETLLGPLLGVLTRLARGIRRPADADELRATLAAQAAALAAHPSAPFELRLAAGALAIEHRSPAIQRAHACGIAAASSS